MTDSSFTLKFDYHIRYKRSDLLYFGINFFLGFREFPIRLRGGSTGSPTGGGDLSPTSTTFTYQSPNTIDVSNSNLFDINGLNELELEMLYSDPTNRNPWTFRMGSVAIKQVIEFNLESGSLNNFFAPEQYTEISNVVATVTIGGKKTELISKLDRLQLGKQYGETLLLSYSSSD